MWCHISEKSTKGDGFDKLNNLRNVSWVHEADNIAKQLGKVAKDHVENKETGQA